MRYFCEKEVLIFAPTGDIKTESQQVELYLANNQLYNHGMVTINHQPTSRKVINLQIGDLVQIEGYQFVIKEDQILEFVAQELGEIEGLIAIDNLIQAYPDYPEYTNSPRIKYDISDEKVELERIPEKSKDTSKANLMKKLIPALVGIIVAILMLWVRPRGIRGILMLITTFVAFAISLINLYTDRRENRIHNANRHDIYSKYLAEKREELASLKLRELASFNHNFLSMSEMIAEIKNCTYRLFERDIKDEDFLKLRLGTYEAEPTYQLNNPFEKLELRYEEADEELRELYEEYEQIKHVPLLTDVKHNTGLVGNRYVISEQLKNILMQLIFSHSYLDLKIVVITNEDFVDDYKYAFKMKHFSDNDNHHKIFITNAKERDQFLGAYTQVLRSRKQVYKPGMIFDQHYLFIIDNPSLVNNHPIMEFFESDELSLMFSIIQIAKTRNELPKYIRTVIDYRTYEQAYLELENGKVRNLDFSLPHISESNDELEAIYLRLCNLEHIKGIKSSIPDQLGFLEMYDVNSPSELNINERWQTNHAYKSLAALMGKKSETDYLYMDLHEKVHGPHGLVAGTTGSGKSEVIQTYILSLALNFSPEQVGFLLIDYKGGGMANLFKDMPHHLGSITNLDGYQSMRALMSIKSELKRRQQIFADINVNHINSYQKLFEQGKVSEALPHLFLISDEFAELKAEQPDFMKELVSAARIGRSLGIHLILATQKPDGVVDDQIWSNSKFKLSLKVAEEADSKALLKTSDAAYITNPGRGYLKVGNNELYELFQSGYSGAELSTNETKKINREIYQVDDHGVRELLNPEECVDEVDEAQESLTELDAVLNEITAVYSRNKLVPVKKPWLAPLENSMLVPKITNEVNEELKALIGKIDIPDLQSQTDLYIDFNENRNVIICGSQGMGKTSTITTTILGLGTKMHPKNLKFYVLDLGNSGLLNLRNLDHVADYLKESDEDKILLLIKYLLEEFDERKNIFDQQNVADIKQYNSFSKEKMQTIIVIIDNFRKIYELDSRILEEVQYLLREGYVCGIKFLVSNNSFVNLKQTITDEFDQRIILNTEDIYDVSMSIGKTVYSQQNIPGRGHVLLTKPEVTQLYVSSDLEDAFQYSNAINNIILDINAMYKYQNKALPTMPSVIKYQERSIVGNQMYVGYSFETKNEKMLEAGSLLIYGPIKSGKSNIAKLVLEQYLKSGKTITIHDWTGEEYNGYSNHKNVKYLNTVEQVQKYYNGEEYSTDLTLVNKMDLFDDLNRKESTIVFDTMAKLFKEKKHVIVETDEIIKSNTKFGLNLLKYGTKIVTCPIEDQKYIGTKDKKQKSEKVGIDEAWIYHTAILEKLKFEEINSKEAKLVLSREELVQSTKSENELLVYGQAIEIEDMILHGDSVNKDIDVLFNEYQEKEYDCILIEDGSFGITREKIHVINENWQVQIDELISSEKKLVIALDPKNIDGTSRDQRIELLEYLGKQIGKVKFIIVANRKLSGTDMFSKHFKKWNIGLLSANINDQSILKIRSSKLKSEETEYKENIRYYVNGKETKKIKDGK